MLIDLQIKNYRGFPDSSPVVLAMRPGFLALVGPNNSGKSSILRFFYELRPTLGSLSDISQLATALRGPQGLGYAELADPAEIFFNGNDRPMSIEIRVHGDLGPELVFDGTPVPKVTRATLTTERGSMTSQLELSTADGATMRNPSSVAQDGPMFTADTLRGDVTDIALAFSQLASTVYIGPFRNAINAGAGRHYDLPVGQAFIETWRTLKTGNQKAQAEAVYRLTRDIQDVFGFQALEINASADGQTLQVFIDGKSYRLPELGSGLTHFLLVLTQIATASPAWVLIDEPELNLHPSLQLDFLTTIGSYTTNGVIFTTHSIGLARASADAVYTVRKSDSQSHVSPLESVPSLAEFLGEMSFSGYRDLGASTVLLVEGPTDVTAIQQLLRKRKKDHEIVILPLGGTSMINAHIQAQLEEIGRLSDQIYAIVDSEKTDEAADLPADRRGFVAACETAGVVVHVLERRALENYMTDRAISAAQPNASGGLAPFQSLSDLERSWSKRENWRIARELTWEEVERTDLGQFLLRVTGETGQDTTRSEGPSTRDSGPSS